MSLIDRLLHNSRSDDNSGKGEEQPAPSRGVKPAAASVARKPGDGEPDIQEMLRDFEDIQDIIGADDAKGPESALVTISMTLAEILEALPPDCVTGKPATPELAVQVTVRDPFTQLKTGKVTAEVADVIRNVPDEFLSGATGNHLSDAIPLPLSRVVSAVSPGELAKRTAVNEREPAIHDMPNLFAKEMEDAQEISGLGEPESSAPPLEPAVVAEKTAEPAEVAEEAVSTETHPQEQAPVSPVAERETEPAPVAAETKPPSPTAVRRPQVTAPTPASQPPEPVDETLPAPATVAKTPTGPLPPVYVAGLDINSAASEEFVDAFEGVGPKLAQKIIAHRPYTSPLGLSRVAGLGRALYQRMTGERLPHGHVDMRTISSILGESGGAMPDLKAVAQAVSEMPGVAGCILSHTDGYLMAQAWKRGKGQSIGAIAPQLFKQVGKYFELLQMEGPDSMTIFVDPRPVFISRSGDVFMIALISRSRLSIKRLTFLEVLTSELMKRMKRAAS